MTSSATSTETRTPLEWGGRLAVPVFLVLGVPVVLGVYNWTLTTSAVFLWFAWASLVVTAKLLWSAFWSVASDSEEEEIDQAVVDRSLRGDLLREKKALLRSIKDVEFDRDMGKMSGAEAGQILRVYRARAIEIIKQLESGNLDDDSVSPEEAIERELEARLAGAATTASERTEAEAAAYARQMQELEELEGRDTHIYRIAGGGFLFAVGVFVTLATYSAAAGGGYYILWYGPMASGLALVGKGFYGLSQLKSSEQAKHRESSEDRK